MAIRTVTHTGPVHQIREDDGVYDNDVAVVRDRAPNLMAARIVWFIADLLLILLAFRFFLALFGANPNNAFANFIYSVSHPFVAPFFSLFSYSNYQLGVARFEVYTLVAMAVYAVIAWVIARLLTIDRAPTEV